MGLPDKTRIDLIQKAHQYCLDNVPGTPVHLCVMKRLKEMRQESQDESNSKSAFSKVMHRIRGVFKKHANQ